MIATVSSKGRLVIPEAIREQAGLAQGDQVDIRFADGLVIIRKHQPLTKARIRVLLTGGRDHPEQTAQEEQEVVGLVREIRRCRRQSSRRNT